MPTITLLTDFGTADYYLAAVRGTLLRLAPGATLVDVSHEVAPGDVESAAFLLAATTRWFAAGTVHLAVVDPGVGSTRRILAASCGTSWLVAPDNGLLTPFFDAVAAPAGTSPTVPPGRTPLSEVRNVVRADLYLPGPGATFHGRDRFAPVAAWLARGEPFSALGPVITDPVRLSIPTPRAEGEPPEPGTAGAVLHGRVAHVDRFGNLVTDLPTSWIGDATLVAEVGDHRTALRATHYGAIPAGQAAVLSGSLGTLELALAGERLATAWQVPRGALVTVHVGGATSAGGGDEDLSTG